MAVILEGGCCVSEMREGQCLTRDTLKIWNRIGRATGAQAISLRILEFGPGRSPLIQNDECDQVLYLIDSLSGANQPGDCSVTFAINGRGFRVEPDSGICVRPQQSFQLHNDGIRPAVFISALCPDPNRSPRFLESARTRLDEDPFQEPPIVRLADRPPQPTADRWYRVIVDDEIGSTQVTQFVGSIPPGRAPDHFHNYEEVLFILKGKGRMWAGSTNTDIGAGSCIYLPRGQVHCVENLGAEELRLLGVFYPAGSPSVRYETE